MDLVYGFMDKCLPRNETKYSRTLFQYQAKFEEETLQKN